jgi:hypothetical protein
MQVRYPFGFLKWVTFSRGKIPLKRWFANTLKKFMLMLYNTEKPIQKPFLTSDVNRPTHLLFRKGIVPCSFCNAQILCLHSFFSKQSPRAKTDSFSLMEKTWNPKNARGEGRLFFPPLCQDKRDAQNRWNFPTCFLGRRGVGDEIKMNPQLIYVSSTYLPGVLKVETWEFSHLVTKTSQWIKHVGK